MKTNIRILSVFLLLCILVSCFVSCQPETPGTTTTQQGGTTLPEWVDYAGLVKFNPNSGRAYQEVTMRLHIDGDTTHFDTPPIKVNDTKTISILKARYLSIDTPESTGLIEEWGKKASNFTKEKLSSATSIIVESDTDTWNADSTGDRYIVWVWYKTADMTDYRNLNIELLQEGYARVKGTDHSYGQVAWDATQQAIAYRLRVHSKDPDPDFYRGEAIELDVKQLATVDLSIYEGKTVAFDAVVIKNYSQGLYVQAFCEETQMFHGMYVYYGFSFKELSMLKVGNLLRIVGTVQYWAGGNTYQISNIQYTPYNPSSPRNIQVLAKNQEIVYKLTTPDQFVNGKVDVTVLDKDGEETIKTFKYAQLALNTAIEMKNLTVTDVYTTQSDTDSNGAMTLTCTAEGKTITVRTEVLRDAEGNVVTADYFEGKTIDVKGVVEVFNNKYQIKLVSLNDAIVHE